MTRSTWIRGYLAVSAALVSLVMFHATMARPALGRGGGGGRPGGVGGARPSGGGGRPSGGGARPGGGGGSRPQMSRPPQASRPSLGSTNRPSGGNMSGGARPGGASGGRPSLGGAGGNPGGARPQTPNVTRPAPGGNSRPGSSGIANKPPGTVRPTTRPGGGGSGIGGDRPGTGSIAGRPDFGGNRPGTGGNRPGIGGDRPGTGGDRPGIGGNRPGTGGDRPGIGGDRPGAGGGSGIVNRPGTGGDRPNFGNLNRPTTLPGNIANRPGIGGDRPGIGGDRPGTGGNRPGIGGDRPGIGGGDRPNRPDFPNRPNKPDRPIVGGNRPGNRPGIGNGIGNGSGNTIIGGGNNINIGSGNGNNIANRPNWDRPGWNQPGWGWGNNNNWQNNWHNNCINNHHNWYNGCWRGYWGSGWYSPVAWGAVGWGLGAMTTGWGYSNAYYNPYYAVPTTAVATMPYDYSQPVVVNNYVSSDATGGEGGTAQADPQQTNETNPGLQRFDDGLADFKASKYQASLDAFNEALKQIPGDPVIHEIRALALFAMGDYKSAAASLNSLLSAAPGMDWTTMSGLYGSEDEYTAQLRKLEKHCKANPTDASAAFVLAYHYLVTGAQDAAVNALRAVVKNEPKDVTAKRMLDALAPPSAAKPDAPAPPAPQPPEANGPETDLVGNWVAKAGNTKIELSITEASQFQWKATQGDKPSIALNGELTTTADALVLESKDQGSMAGSVKSQGADKWQFVMSGAPANDPGLSFERVK